MSTCKVFVFNDEKVWICLTLPNLEKCLYFTSSDLRTNLTKEKEILDKTSSIREQSRSMDCVWVYGWWIYGLKPIFKTFTEPQNCTLSSPYICTLWLLYCILSTLYIYVLYDCCIIFSVLCISMYSMIAVLYTQYSVYLCTLWFLYCILSALYIYVLYDCCTVHSVFCIYMYSMIVVLYTQYSVYMYSMNEISCL